MNKLFGVAAGTIIVLLAVLLIPRDAAAQQASACPAPRVDPPGVLDSIQAVYLDVAACIGAPSGCGATGLLERIDSAKAHLGHRGSLATMVPVPPSAREEGSLSDRLLANLNDLRSLVSLDTVKSWEGGGRVRIDSLFHDLSEDENVVRALRPLSARVQGIVMFRMRSPFRTLAASLDSIGLADRATRRRLGHVGYLLLEREYRILRFSAGSCWPGPTGTGLPGTPGLTGPPGLAGPQGPPGPPSSSFIPTGVGWGLSIHASNTVGAGGLFRWPDTLSYVGAQVLGVLGQELGGGGEVTYGRQHGPLVWQAGLAYLSTGFARWGSRWGPTASIVFPSRSPLSLGITASTPQGVGIRAVYWVQPAPRDSPSR